MVKGVGERALRYEQGGHLLHSKDNPPTSRKKKKKILDGSEAWVLETI